MAQRGSTYDADEGLLLGVQSWSPFVTRKSGHIWRIWPQMTQTVMPKSSKVAQIPTVARLQFRQNSPSFRPNSRQISPN